MNAAHRPHDEQMQIWNGPGGRGWVEAQRALEQMFQPFEELLLKAVPVGSGIRVLDVGCGTGSTTLAVARLLAGSGCCLGIDISESMLALARSRAKQESLPANFIQADAQSYGFEPASVDLIISRFGVMFFDDFIQAFANLRQAARNHAELRFLAWRDAAENSFMTAAERAAVSLLPDIPTREPGRPGQFAFEDPTRVNHILVESGWTQIDICPIDVSCSFPERELIRYLSHMGPVGRALQQMDDRTRREVIGAIRPAFDPYVHGSEVRFTAACWMVSARAPRPFC